MKFRGVAYMVPPRDPIWYRWYPALLFAEGEGAVVAVRVNYFLHDDPGAVPLSAPLWQRRPRGVVAHITRPDGRSGTVPVRFLRQAGEEAW